MDLESKKAQIYRLTKLGMDQYSCELLAGCTDEELSLLTTDAVYQAHCKLHVMMEERDLLCRLDRIIDMNEERGISTEVRWKLEKINPKKWGKSISVAGVSAPESRALPDLSALSSVERDTLLDAVSKLLPGIASGDD